MKSLNNIRGHLPSSSLMLHYVMIALLLSAMGAGVVWYGHVEKVLTAVEWNAKQVTGLADGLRDELPDRPEADAKLYRIQLEALHIQSSVKSIPSRLTSSK